MLTALIATVTNAAEVLIDRHVLSKEHIPYKLFVPLSFALLFGIMLLLSPFMFTYDPAFFEMRYLLIFAAVIVLAIIGNYFFFYGLAKEKVNAAEPFILMQYITTIIVAVTLFKDERNWISVMLALVATGTLLASRVERHHLKIDKYAAAILVGSVAFGTQNAIIKELLKVYNPFTLYFLRAGVVGLILLLFFKFEHKGLNVHKVEWMALSSALVVAQFIALYWSFEQIGVVRTTLITCSAPLIALWGSKAFLREKLKWRNIIATIVITCCIAASLTL